jgi:hypothetical protein
VTDTLQEAAAFAFDLEYGGPALANHEMDVRDLAPALLNAADLFRTLNRQVHPTDPEVQVNIKATGEGSFLIQLRMLYEHTQNVLGNQHLLSDEGFAGLFALVLGTIRYVRKRGSSGPPASIEPVDQGDVLVRVTWPDGTVMEIMRDALRMADNPVVRRQLAEVVRPVAQSGIDSLGLKQADHPTFDEVVSKDDLPALQTPAEVGREILSVSERPVYLTIRAPSFDPGLKWRFYDGLVNFAAPIVDADFIARVGRREEAFAVGDVLNCSVRTTQWRDSGGIHSEVEVVKVHGHLPPAEPDLAMF